jgi:uncharacterized membrane protein YfcA
MQKEYRLHKKKAERREPMKFKYPMLLLLFALFAVFAGYVILERQGIQMPSEIFGTLLLFVLVGYAYLWQRKWKEDREKLIEQVRSQKDSTREELKEW